MHAISTVYGASGSAVNPRHARGGVSSAPALGGAEPPQGALRPRHLVRGSRRAPMRDPAGTYAADATPAARSDAGAEAGAPPRKPATPLQPPPAPAGEPPAARRTRPQSAAQLVAQREGGGGGGGSYVPLLPAAFAPEPVGAGRLGARTRGGGALPRESGGARMVKDVGAAGAATLLQRASRVGSAAEPLRPQHGRRGSRAASAARPSEHASLFSGAVGLSLELSLDEALRRQRHTDARLPAHARRERRLALHAALLDAIIAREQAADSVHGRLLPRVKDAYELALQHAAARASAAPVAHAGDAANAIAAAEQAAAEARAASARAEEARAAAELSAAAAREERAALQRLLGEQERALARLSAERDELQRQCYAWADFHAAQGHTLPPRADEDGAEGGAPEQPHEPSAEDADAPPMLPVDPNTGNYTPRLGEGVLMEPAPPDAYRRPSTVPALDLGAVPFPPDDDDDEEEEDEDDDEGDEEGEDEGERRRGGGGADDWSSDGSSSDGGGGGAPAGRPAGVRVGVDALESGPREGSSRPAIPTLDMRRSADGKLAAAPEGARSSFDDEFADAMASAPPRPDELGFDTPYERALQQGPSPHPRPAAPAPAPPGEGAA